MSQILRRKTKRSYEDLLADARSMASKTAAVFIPQMAEALREENPDWSNPEIRNKIEQDCDGIWEYNTIKQFLPSWIHDEKVLKRLKKSWETRHANEINSSIKNIEQIARTPIELPKLPLERSTRFEDMEDADIGVPELRNYGDNVESVLQLYSKINQPAKELFRALTRKDMPIVKEEIVLDFLKPSREFRNGIFYEIDDGMKSALYNTLVWTRDAIDDTLNLLEKAMKSEKRA